MNISTIKADLSYIGSKNLLFYLLKDSCAQNINIIIIVFGGFSHSLLAIQPPQTSRADDVRVEIWNLILIFQTHIRFPIGSVLQQFGPIFNLIKFDPYPIHITTNV